MQRNSGGDVDKPSSIMSIIVPLTKEINASSVYPTLLRHNLEMASNKLLGHKAKISQRGMERKCWVEQGLTRNEQHGSENRQGNAFGQVMSCAELTID